MEVFANTCTIKMSEYCMQAARCPPPPPVSPQGLRDTLLATGPGKVGALLADGDWLLLSASRSNVGPRRYFNHWEQDAASRSPRHLVSGGPSLLAITYLHVHEATCVYAT